MKRLTFQRPHDLTKLHGELEAAVPALRPVNGEQTSTIAGNGTTLSLLVPDEVNDAAVAMVVNAHDPTTPSATKQEATAQQQAIADFVASVDALLTAIDPVTGMAWDLLPPNQRTVTIRRFAKALKALAKRAGG